MYLGAARSRRQVLLRWDGGEGKQRKGQPGKQESRKAAGEQGRPEGRKQPGGGNNMCKAQ